MPQVFDGNLTADGEVYQISGTRSTGDVVQFERCERAIEPHHQHRALWTERLNYVEGHKIFSRDGTQIAYDRYTNEGKPQLRIRNLDCSNLRTIYDESSTIPFDWSPDAGSILALRGIITDNVNELVLISTKDSSVRVLKKIESGP